MTAWNRNSRTVAVVVGTTFLVACSSDGAARPPTGTAVISVGAAAGGTTVRISPGSILRVSLGSTYWRFAPDSDPDVLRRTGLTAAADTSAPRIPGAGRGLVVATYAALAVGSATIRAARSSCGEALRCVGGQGSYRLTVVVR